MLSGGLIHLTHIYNNQNFMIPVIRKVWHLLNILKIYIYVLSHSFKKIFKDNKEICVYNPFQEHHKNISRLHQKLFK